MKVKELSERYKISRQGICHQVKRGRIPAQKVMAENNKYEYEISELDFIHYLYNRYSRTNPIFSEEGNYTVKDCAKVLGCTIQSVYHHLRFKNLVSKRIGCSWVIHPNDLKDFKSKLILINNQPDKYERKFKSIRSGT